MAKRATKARNPEQGLQEGVQTLFGKTLHTPVEVEVEKRFSTFDFVNDINFNKQYLFAEETQSSYDPFVVNKAVTIFPDTFAGGEFLNSNYHLDKKLQHDYLFFTVQKRRRWKQGGWLKKTEQEKKELHILKDVAEAIGYNLKRTKHFWSVLTQEQQKAFLERYIYPDSKNAKK